MLDMLYNIYIPSTYANSIILVRNEIKNDGGYVGEEGE